MNIKIKRLYPEATLPTSADTASAGNDLYAYIPEGFIIIRPGTTRFIKTGIACAIPEGYFGGIYARSGLGCKKNLRPANCVAVIDASYRGEILVALHNDSKEDRVIRHGDRVAQMVIQPCQYVTWDEVDELDKTERGNGGFGHSGN